MKPNVIFEGYCGALLDFKQLSTGRLVCPFAWWVPERPCAPPVGANLCTVFYSDDGGDTWTKSESDLSSPCYANFVGNNYGADEPCILEMKGGRLWMLMRTQTGFLYESFSADQGKTWSEAQPSRFVSSSSPPMLWRMPDGRIIILWNNCESPPAHEGAGVYVNRDALHAAVSDDEGRTWRGFREVYRDPHENETPPDTDRGSAYPTPPGKNKWDILLYCAKTRMSPLILSAAGKPGHLRRCLRLLPRVGRLRLPPGPPGRLRAHQRGRVPRRVGRLGFRPCRSRRAVFHDALSEAAGVTTSPKPISTWIGMRAFSRRHSMLSRNPSYSWCCLLQSWKSMAPLRTKTSRCSDWLRR
ncbi:MAG: exo-alpha-sialidase [Rhodopirellula sp.]|nr:exo-alpha-sialidase [Rhodopirellula sp.]